MKLTQHELIAVRWWMEEQGLSGKAAAAALEITERALRKWLAGGGMHPSQRAKLLALLEPYLVDSKDIEKIEREKAGLDLREGWPGEPGTITGYAAYQASDRAIKKHFGLVKPPAQRGDLAAYTKNREESPVGQLQKRDKHKLSDGEYRHKHEQNTEFSNLDTYVEHLIEQEVYNILTDMREKHQLDAEKITDPIKKFSYNIQFGAESLKIATGMHSPGLHRLLTCHHEAGKKRNKITSSKSDLMPDECAHLIGKIIYLNELLKGMNEYRRRELNKVDDMLSDKIIDVVNFRIQKYRPQA